MVTLVVTMSEPKDCSPRYQYKVSDLAPFPSNEAEAVLSSINCINQLFPMSANLYPQKLLFLWCRARIPDFAAPVIQSIIVQNVNLASMNRVMKDFLQILIRFVMVDSKSLVLYVQIGSEEQVPPWLYGSHEQWSATRIRDMHSCRRTACNFWLRYLSLHGSCVNYFMISSGQGPLPKSQMCLSTW